MNSGDPVQSLYIRATSFAIHFKRGGVLTGIRTPVPTVKGLCARPLDDEDLFFGGGKRDRTADLLHAMQALSQLSYTPDNRVEKYSIKKQGIPVRICN